MGGDCLARVSVSLFVDRESEESRLSRRGAEWEATVSQESQSLCLLTEKVRRVQRSRVGGDCLARVSVSLFVDRESEESPEEPNGRRLSRKSLSLFVC